MPSVVVVVDHLKLPLVVHQAEVVAVQVAASMAPQVATEYQDKEMAAVPHVFTMDKLFNQVVAVVRAQVVEMVPTVRQTRLAVLVESARLRI